MSLPHEKNTSQIMDLSNRGWVWDYHEAAPRWLARFAPDQREGFGFMN